MSLEPCCRTRSLQVGVDGAARGRRSSAIMPEGLFEALFGASGPNSYGA